MDDTRPFPIQPEPSIPYGSKPNSVIPWWLAEEAYKHYSKRFGKDQSLERLAERGGFGRKELLMLLRKEC